MTHMARAIQQGERQQIATSWFHSACTYLLFYSFYTVDSGVARMNGATWRSSSAVVAFAFLCDANASHWRSLYCHIVDSVHGNRLLRFMST